MVYLSAVLLYLLFLHPAINWKDSGELVTGGFLLTPLHFPGYPLYAQLAKLCAFLPLGSIANRVSLLNGVCGAAAGTLLLQSLARETRAPGIAGAWFKLAPRLAVVFVLALLLSPTFLEESTIAENTMPFITLLAFSLVFPFAFDSRRRLAAGLWPLCLFLSYHLLFFAAGCAGLLFVSLAARSPLSRIHRLTVLFPIALLAASTYLFIPLRTNRPVRLAETGASSLDEWRAVLQSGLHKRAIKSERPDDAGWFAVGVGRLLGKSESGEGRSESRESAVTPPRGAGQAEVLGRSDAQPLDAFRRGHFKSEYVVFLVPIWMLGMIWIARKAPAATFIHVMVFIILLGATASQAGQETRGQSLPLAAYAASWAGATVLWSLERGRVLSRILGGVLLLLGAFALARNLAHLGHHAKQWADARSSDQEREPMVLGDRIVSGLDPGSLVMISYPRMATMFYYYLYVENRRPDLDVVIEPLLVSPYYHAETGMPGEHDRRSFVAFLGADHKNRILSVAAKSSPSRAVYRDSSFYEIKISNLQRAALSPEAWSKVDWTRVRLDPWEALKLFLGSIKADDLPAVLETTSDAPSVALQECGLLYRLQRPIVTPGAIPFGCPNLSWPRTDPPSDPGTREVTAFYEFRKGVFHLGRGDAAAASRAFHLAISLNPQSPL